MSASRILKFAVLHAALTLTTGHAFAGGGEGFNGPVTSTTSIPIQVDRGISNKDIQAAVRTCLLDGDPSRQLSSLYERIAKIFIGMDAKKLGGDLSDIIEVKPIGQSTFVVSSHVQYNSPDNKYISFTTDDLSSIGGMATISVGQNQNSMPRNSSLWSNLDEVYISYKSVTGQPEFDELGNVVQDNQLYSGLSLYVAPDLANSGYKANFRNQTTGKVLAITVDVKGYIDCLQSELEQKAK